jgi:hypothetical protein
MIASDASRDGVQVRIDIRTLSRHNSISRIAIVYELRSAPGKKPERSRLAITPTHSEFLERVPLPRTELEARGIINDG